MPRIIQNDDDERTIPRVRLVSHTDHFTTTPPPDWSLVYTFYGPPPKGYIGHIGDWLCLIDNAHELSRTYVQRQYRISRDRAGDRVLLVAPTIASEMSNLVDEINYYTQEVGYAYEDRVADAQVSLAKRAWRKMPLVKRVAMASDWNIDVTLAMDPSNTSLLNPTGKWGEAELLEAVIEEVIS